MQLAPGDIDRGEEMSLCMTSCLLYRHAVFAFVFFISFQLSNTVPSEGVIASGWKAVSRRWGTESLKVPCLLFVKGNAGYC